MRLFCDQRDCNGTTFRSERMLYYRAYLRSADITYQYVNPLGHILCCKSLCGIAASSKDASMLLQAELPPVATQCCGKIIGEGGLRIERLPSEALWRPRKNPGWCF